MSARGLAALVVGLGGGYLKGKDRQRREDIEDEDRAYTMTQRARQQAENERADKLRTDMGNASMPTTVEAAPVAMPIGSRDEPRAPEDVGIRAAGQTFTDRAAADKAAADYNTPQATAARQAQVAAAAGDPHLAQQLRTGSMQEQVAKLQLSAGERAELKAKFADQINPLADFGQLGEFMSASAADGQGGKLKMQFVPAADGKTMVLNMVNPDGSLKPTASTFDNDGKGLALAKAQLNGIPPEKMLEHFHREAVEARAAAAQQSTEKYQAGMLKNAQDKTAAGIEIAQIRADAAAQGRALRLAQASAPAGIDMAGADKFINELFSNKDQMTGAATFDPVGADAVRGLMLGMPSAKNGDTQGAVNQALMVYNRYLKMAGGDQAKALEFIRQARSAPAAPAPGGGQTAAAPAPKGPERPGMLDRAAAAVKGMLADGAETGRQMEAIRARVMDAGKGGAPLTPAERTQAKKYGITPTS